MELIKSYLEKSYLDSKIIVPKEIILSNLEDVINGVYANNKLLEYKEIISEYIDYSGLSLIKLKDPGELAQSKTKWRKAMKTQFKNLYEYSEFMHSPAFSFFVDIIPEQIRNMKMFVLLIYLTDVYNLLRAYKAQPYDYIIELTLEESKKFNYMRFFINEEIEYLEIQFIDNIDTSLLDKYKIEYLLENNILRFPKPTIKVNYLLKYIFNQSYYFIMLYKNISYIFLRDDLKFEKYMNHPIIEIFEDESNYIDYPITRSILKNDLKSIVHITHQMSLDPLFHDDLHQYLDRYIKVYDNVEPIIYYNLALLLINKADLSDRDLILKYLFYAGNYDDAPRLRTKLFFEYSKIHHQSAYNIELTPESMVELSKILRNK